MRERAESVGGTLSVESGPGSGTTVVVTVPRSAAALSQVS
jgi:signal transduction histidine kinase